MNKIVPTLELSHIKRSYGQRATRLDVLKDVNLTLMPGEIVALLGPSGAGKSTLLHIAGLLDAPTAGTIRVQGQDVARINDKKRTALRCKTMGFVYQAHLLLPDFSALENVVIPQLIAGAPQDAARARAAELLAQVGLEHRLTHRAGQLSGGEQQRVALARALANRPALLLADEPTGNLDPHTAEGVFGELLDLIQKTKLSALIATHNPVLAARMSRQVLLKDGELA